MHGCLASVHHVGRFDWITSRRNKNLCCDGDCVFSVGLTDILVSTMEFICCFHKRYINLLTHIVILEFVVWAAGAFIPLSTD